MDKKAFTLIELMIVVALIGVVMSGAAAYAYLKNVQKAQLNVCLKNRKLIEKAEQLYLFEKGEYSGSIQDLVDAGYIKNYPECPSGGVYAWVSEPEGSDIYHSVVVCSVHSDTVGEEELTGLVSTFEERSGRIIELLEKYYEENGKYPRNWGKYVFTDLGLDPDEWKKAYGGLIYSPAGKRLKIEPAEGYRMIMTDLNGEEKVLTSSLNWNLWYDIKSGKWYYKNTKPDSEVDIDTLII